MSSKYPGGVVTAGADTSYSVAFDGSGDYLSTATNAAFAFGTGNFTIEAWVYVNAQASYQNFVDTRTSQSSSATGVYFGINTGTLTPVFYKTSATLTATSSITAATWTHVALVRSGTTVTIYINGTASGTVTDSTNFTDNSFYAGNSLAGYISNLRVNKGTAVYTANFTPPTQMFPISGTSILTCQNPTIIDNSSNGFTITANGDTKVSNFTPFAAYTGFNPALGAAAPGVWTISQAEYYQANRQWPIYDPYFNQTTLMLHGNGTNGAQNNTFLDSSTNNFAITRNGNATQGTFTPFSQTGWSLYIPGANSSYVQTPSSSTSNILGGALTSLGSLSFTIECFINTAGNIFLFGAADPGAGTADMILGIGSDGLLSFGATFSGYTTRYSTGAAPLNTWCHVAWVVTGGYVNFYVNGVPVGSATVGNTSASYGQLIWGGYNNGFSAKYFVSNFRITKSAVYTGAFNVPTSNLPALSNTSLLVFQGNNYKDNSVNNYTLTINASPSIQPFGPFVPSYITPTTYSNLFDGTGDYLTTPSATALQITAASAFTFEAWIYPTFTIVSAGAKGIVGKRDSTTEWQFYVASDGTLGVYNGSTAYTSGTVLPGNNQWIHVSATWDLTTLRFFINGTLCSTTYTSFSLGSASTNQLTVGGTYPNGELWTGLISNLRVLKGTALYTAAFTPPSAPLTNITGTSLLTCQSSTLIDNSSNAFTITAYGDTKPVASPIPFAPKVDQTTLNSAYSTSLVGGSYYGDGSGDYLVNNSANLQVGSSTNFTLEFWVYRTSSFTSDQGRCVFAIGSETTNRMQFTLYGSAARVEVYAGTLDFNGGTIPINAWTHVAFVRSGSTISIYINGVFATSASWSGVIGNTSGFIFGANRSVSNYIDCYVSGLRLLNGTALYTSNFAPPVAPPTAIANTTLLLNFTNAGIIDSTAKTVWETVGDAKISTTKSKWGGSSMYFDGTGDYLFANSSTNNIFNIGTGDFTVETWVNFDNISNNPCICSGYADASNGWYFQYYSNNIELALGSTAIISKAATVSNGTWYHMAVTRAGGTLRAFLNGVQQGTSVTSNTSNLNVTNGFYVGILNSSFAPTTRTFAGYLNDLRITKGYARYTTNFTPPTSSFQNQ